VPLRLFCKDLTVRLTFPANKIEIILIKTQENMAMCYTGVPDSSKSSVHHIKWGEIRRLFRSRVL